MKKIVRLLLLTSAALIITSCAKAPKDEFAPYRNMTSQELYVTAERQLAKGHYSDATKRFEAMDAIYPFGPYAEQSDLDIIFAYYKNDDQASAVAAADRYIRLYPESDNVDYAYYMKGVVSYDIGLSWVQRRLDLDPTQRDLADKKAAFLAFQQLALSRPDSRYTPDALYRMAVIRNMVARKEVIIAQFYLDRQVYLAAANRASDVVAHYDGSPEVIPALAIMTDAYQQMGLLDMAAQTLEVFAASYPNAPQLKPLMAEQALLMHAPHPLHPLPPPHAV